MPDSGFGANTITDDPDRVVIRLSGEFDTSAAPLARYTFETAEALPRGELVVDLGGVSFLDSVAIGVLIASYKRVHASSRAFRVVNANPAVWALLQLTGLQKIFTITAQ